MLSLLEEFSYSYAALNLPRVQTIFNPSFKKSFFYKARPGILPAPFDYSFNNTSEKFFAIKLKHLILNRQIKVEYLMQYNCDCMCSQLESGAWTPESPFHITSKFLLLAPSRFLSIIENHLHFSAYTKKTDQTVTNCNNTTAKNQILFVLL